MVIFSICSLLVTKVYNTVVSQFSAFTCQDIIFIALLSVHPIRSLRAVVVVLQVEDLSLLHLQVESSYLFQLRLYSSFYVFCRFPSWAGEYDDERL